MITDCWNGAAAALGNLFNGSDSSNNQLFDLISDGKLFNLPILDRTTVQTISRRVNYGYLMPIAWSLSNQNVFPFILDAGVDCSKPTYFDSLIYARVCYNGWYYLLLNWYINSDGRLELQYLPGNEDLISGTYQVTLPDIVAG